MNRVILLQKIQIYSTKMDSKRTFWVGGRIKSNTIDIIEYQKKNPETNKLFKIRRGECDTCGRSKSQIVTKLIFKRTKRKVFQKTSKNKNSP